MIYFIHAVHFEVTNKFCPIIGLIHLNISQVIAMHISMTPVTMNYVKFLLDIRRQVRWFKCTVK